MQKSASSQEAIAKNVKPRPYSRQDYRATTELERNVGESVADFKVVCEIGRGSYGVVYKVISHIDQRIYVMKKINLKQVKLKNQNEALKEAQILRKVRHPNIIKYYTSFVEENHLYIIMEYAEGGDLYAVIYFQLTLLKFNVFLNIS